MYGQPRGGLAVYVCMGLPTIAQLCGMWIHAAEIIYRCRPKKMAVAARPRLRLVGIVVVWWCGGVVLWYCGIVVLWYCGIVVLW